MSCEMSVTAGMSSRSRTQFHSVDDQMRQFIPSDEIVTYFRQKIQQVGKDYEELLNQVELCKEACDASLELQKELNQRHNQISKLQKTVSDLQVYIFQEREQSLNLRAENDFMKIQQSKSRKKIHSLLSLSGLVKNDTKLFKCNPQKTLLVPRKLSPRLQKYSSEHNLEGVCKSFLDDVRSQDESDGSEKCCPCDCGDFPDDSETLRLKVVSLTSQIEEQRALYRDELSALHKDRDICQWERDAEREQLQQQVDFLTARLQSVQENLCEVTADLVRTKDNLWRQELGWTAEKSKLTSALEMYHRQLELFCPKTKACDETGVCYHICSRKKLTPLKAEINNLKQQLKEKESIASDYQSLCTELQEDVVRLRDEVQAVKNIYKERIEKLNSQVAYIRSKYNDLDRRRRLENEGFLSDIKILRQDIRDIEKHIHKIRHQKDTHMSSNYQYQTDMELQDSVGKAHQLEQKLNELKKKVARF